MQFKALFLGALALTSGALASTSGSLRADSVALRSNNGCSQIASVLEHAAAQLTKPSTEAKDLTKENVTEDKVKEIVSELNKVVKEAGDSIKKLQDEGVSCQIAAKSSHAKRQGDAVTQGVYTLLPKVNQVLLDVQRIVNALPLPPVVALVAALEPALATLIVGLEAVVAGGLLPVLSTL